MNKKFMIDGQLYRSSPTRLFSPRCFRDGVEITLVEFYDAFFRLLR